MYKGKGKKRGSTILMVLMVSTILIILSATIMSSLIFTTIGNDLAKNKSDYVYAAEGGIEYGIEKYSKEGVFTTLEEVEYLGNSSAIEKKEIHKVIVTCVERPDRDLLVSKVLNKDNEVLGEINIPIKIKRGISKILEYTICPSRSITVDSDGAFSFAPAKVAYNDENGTKDIDGTPISNPIVDIIDTVDPKFSSYVVEDSTTRIYTSLEDLFNKAKNKQNGFNEMTLTQNNSEDGKLSDGLGYYNLNGIHVIFVSCDELVIANTGGTNLSNTVLIVDGKLSIFSNANVNLTRSTLYPKEIAVDIAGALTMRGAPLYDVSGSGTLPNDVAIANGMSGNGNINKTDIEEFDKLLQKYMSDYGASSEISGIPEVGYGDSEYKF